jgi:hypothetical protein
MAIDGGASATEERATTAAPVPPMVGLALRAALAQMLVMTVATVVTYFLQDTLRDASITAHAAATGQTIAAVRESSFAPFGFFRVALTMLATYVPLALVLVAMVRVGARWALYTLTALVGMSAVVQLVLGTTPGTPVLLMLLAAVSVALHGLTLLLLWHPANRRYFQNAHSGHWARVVDED